MIPATPRPMGQKIDMMNMEATLRAMRTDMAWLHEIVSWAALGRELLAVLTEKSELRLRQTVGTFTAQAVPGLPVHRETLLSAIAAINQNETAKCCQRCRESKTLGHFAKSKTSPDGHWRYCLECERKRVSAYEKKKKGW